MTPPPGTRTSWRAKLDRPQQRKVIPIPRSLEKKLGKGSVLIPHPLDVDLLIRKVPRGRLITDSFLRERLARMFDADVTCPESTAAFVRMLAGAAEEDLRAGRTRVTPYWRVVRDDGSLNEMTRAGIKRQTMLLLKEGHTLTLGKKGRPPRVKDFENVLVAP